jgi:hypothetical protein
MQEFWIRQASPGSSPQVAGSGQKRGYHVSFHLLISCPMLENTHSQKNSIASGMERNIVKFPYGNILIARIELELIFWFLSIWMSVLKRIVIC